MSQASHFDSKYTRTLDSLRRSICLAAPGAGMTLHETALTAEFGMSRTPIRQVLQRLAYERLVETKSGVGTVVTALKAENRERDRLVHAGMLRTAAELDIAELTIAQHSEVLALDGMMALATETDRALQFDVFSKIHGLLSELVPDLILQAAVSASFWRNVRWHMADQAENAGVALTALKRMTTLLTSYEARNGKDLILRLADGQGDR
ncbi:GntR family transcriptional regulator [Roseibium denhamense]|uniref:Transcriptional regulator, GntR family n=1 Tax=Roseibium denhamense TaxID=76305 RepID=A0ABY1P230_9HYPH|nr:GntR family transcriptional regulator [Roseibium denhamense]MTI07603.1 GntR family transcriptional regulator [Roseibium denhamense]SMP24087.1 transcriptional regulator, GntR family [Roseibium denhamense]